MKNPAPPILLECPTCNYRWYCKSKRRYVNCPNCSTSFKKEGRMVKA